MLDPEKFKRKIKEYAEVRKTAQLRPELQLILNNYREYYKKFTEALEGSVGKQYYALRINKLEEWLVNTTGYNDLISAIEQVKTQNLTLFNREHVSKLKNILNYIGILCEDEKILASENFYAMLALLDVISAEDQSNDPSALDARLGSLINDFKRYFVEDSELQRINIDSQSNNLLPKLYASSVYHALADLASAKLDYIYEVYGKKWGETYFSKNLASNSYDATMGSTWGTSLMPAWLKTTSFSPSTRRSSRVASIDVTSSGSQGSSLSLSRSSSRSLSNSNVT